MRRLVIALILVVLAGLAWAGVKGFGRTPPAPAPRLSGSFTTAVGGVSGEDPAQVQRLSYRADLSNSGTAPARGWRWRLELAPELSQRIRSAPQPSEGSLDLEPGGTQSFSGEIIFSTQDWSKAQIAGADPLVWITVTDAQGTEIQALGRHGNQNGGK